MFVSDWMTREVLTLDTEDFVSEAVRLLKEKDIKHLPVLKGGLLEGIISDRDIRDHMPSKGGKLDLYELHQIFHSTKVSDIMKARVRTTSPDTPVEEAAMMLFDNNIGCLPVMDSEKLVGIISDRDIYRALVDISGVRHGGHRVTATIPDRPGSIRDIANIVRSSGFSLMGILTSYEGAEKGLRRVVLRTSREGNFSALKAELESLYREVSIL
jgi:acetoin utilization protein AcuB